MFLAAAALPRPSMQHQLGRVLQSKLLGPACERGVCLALLIGFGLVLGACQRETSLAPANHALTVLLPRDVQQIDPRYVSDAYGHKLSRLLFASLVRIDPQTLASVPDLAERIELVSEREYRVTLRPAMRFSDGSSLDAHDVVATFQSIVDPALRTRYASTYQLIERVTAVDPLTVSFRLKGPHASFVTDLEFPILRAEDASVRLTLTGRTKPISSGPYVLSQRQPGMVLLAPNPHWYAGEPHIPHVRLLVVHDDNTRALRMLSGAADFTLNGVPPGLTPLFTARSEFAVESAPGIGTTYLGINTRAPELSDVRVRRALAHAIDRKALIAAKFQSRAEPAASFIPSGHWAFAPETPSYAYDPERARALLDEAGLRGTPRTRWVMRVSSERFRVSIARAVASMLSDVGIAVTVQPTETATLLADLDRGHFQITLLQFSEVIEPHVLSWFFASDRIPGQGREGLNRWRISDPVLDAAFERGRRSLEREERRAAYVEVQRILAEQLPVIPLWHEAVVAVRSLHAPAISVPRDARFTTLAR